MRTIAPSIARMSHPTRPAQRYVSEGDSMLVIESSDTSHDEQAPQPKKPKKKKNNKGSEQGHNERWQVMQLKKEECTTRYDTIMKELGNLRALWRIPWHPRGLLASHS